MAVALASVLIYVYLPTLLWLGRQWLGAGLFVYQAQNWSHGPIVVIMMGYLLWRGRAEPARPSLWGVPLILGGIGLHLAGVSLEAPYLSAYSLVPVFLGVVSLFFGISSRRVIPGLLFLMAVPFPVTEWGVIGLLAQVVAVASVFLSRLAGAPVLRQGQTIFVGPDEYLVAPLCSGFNFIMALLALVLPLLYLRGASLKTLAAGLLWLPAVGMAAKIALVSAILVLTPWLGQDTALMLYHRWLGLAFYLGGLGVALLIITLVKVPFRNPPLLNTLP